MRFSQTDVHSRWTKSNQSTKTERAKSPHRLNLPKSLRILKRREFQDISRNHHTFTGNQVYIQYREALSPKIGITISRKFGSAVERNRFKRLVREAFRKISYELPPIDIIIMPRKNCLVFSLTWILNDLRQLKGQYAQHSAEKSR